MPLARVALLQLPGDRGIERRKQNCRAELFARPFYFEPSDTLWNPGRKLPATPQRLRVSLPGALIRGQDLRHVEPRVAFEELDEALPYRSRGAEDRDGLGAEPFRVPFEGG